MVEINIFSFLCWNRYLMRHNIGHFTYINFEAVPEKMDIDDFFEEVTLFRKHLCTINLNPQAFLYNLFC
jgi:hypothetical protein